MGEQPHLEPTPNHIHCLILKLTLHAIILPLKKTNVFSSERSKAHEPLKTKSRHAFFPCFLKCSSKMAVFALTHSCHGDHYFNSITTMAFAFLHGHNVQVDVFTLGCHAPVLYL